MDHADAVRSPLWRRVWARLEAFERARDWTPTDDVEAWATRLERRLALLEARFESARPPPRPARADEDTSTGALP